MPDLPHLAPKFRGGRFERNAIPIEFLPDLLAYRDLVRDVAKHLYKARTNKRRVPSAFAQMFRLSLRDVKPGSAVPELVNTVADPEIGAEILQFSDFFAEAKNLVDETVRGTSTGIPAEFPRHLLVSFDKIGRHFQPGEVIDFAPNAKNPARYDNKVRETLVLMARDKVRGDVDLIAKVSGVNDDPQDSFDLRLQTQATVSGPYQPEHEDAIIQAYKGRLKGLWVRVKGSGLFDRQKQLIKLTDVEEVDVLDDEDVKLLESLNRIAMMPALGAGWYGATSLAPSAESASWAAEVLKAVVEGSDVPAPNVYPTPAGEIQLEWKIEMVSIDVRLSGEARTATLFAYADDSDADDVELTLEIKTAGQSGALIDGIRSALKHFAT